MTTKLNNFYHREIINILSNETTVNGTFFPKFKDAAGIQRGFCFSLVMDWLNNPGEACKKYWKVEKNTPKNTPLDVSKYVLANTSIEQYVYFQKLAGYFVNYCNTVTPVFKAKENQFTFSITLDDGNKKSEAIVMDSTLFKVNNAFTQQHYHWIFQNYGARFYEKNDNSFSLTDEFDRRYKTGYKILVNVFFYSYDQNAKLERHSIGMIKLPASFNLQQPPVSVRTDMKYLFFDPTYGVFCTNTHKHFFDSLLSWYAEKNFHPVCIQYNAVQWDK